MMNMMESKNPMLRLIVFGKIKKIVKSYNDISLNETDRRVIRGLFVKNLKDFDEDQREKMSKVPLIDRLNIGNKMKLAALSMIEKEAKRRKEEVKAFV